MAFENVRSISLPPTAANLVRQYRFVVLGTTGFIDEVGAAGADADGVALAQSPASSTAGVTAAEAAQVLPVTLLDGSRQEVEAGGAVTVGANVSSDAQGRGIVAASGHAILGKALSAASGAGERITFISNKAARQV